LSPDDEGDQAVTPPGHLTAAAGTRQYVNLATSSERSPDIRVSSIVVCCVSSTPLLVTCAESATPVMFVVICWTPREASAMFRLVSPVVAVCSSTAEAIVVWNSL